MTSNYKQHNLVNMDKMLHDAKEGHYAILHINAVNYDWMKVTILTAQETNSPIIVALTEKSMKCIISPTGIAHMVYDIMDTYKINVPVALHLDHGSYDAAVECIKAGFSSVMYDGSKEPIDINIKKTNEILALAKQYDVSVEGEVGAIGGKEDGVTGNGEQANPEECSRLAATGISCLAAGIGNVHGIYPADWKGINLKLLEEIKAHTNNIPLVLHGGSGIPTEQVQEAIKLGVCKVNVGTETLLAFTDALAPYFLSGKHKEGKGFDTRKYFPIGYEGVKQKIIEKLKMIGSFGKAK